MKLKKALEKSIKQWQLMVDCPYLSKKEVYIQLGGEKQYASSSACFLCDAFSDNHCEGCLSWNVKNPSSHLECCFCEKDGSPFKKWLDTESESKEEKEAAKKVLEYLKNELEKL